MTKESRKANAVQKALDILLAFTPDNKEMGPTKLSKKLSLHKATTSRIMFDLASKGFLQQNPQTKRFSLGRSALDIGKAITTSLNSNLVPIAKPHIDDLRATIGETVVLEIFTGTETFMGYIAEGPQHVRLAGTLGDRLPVHAAAGAKAVLAFLSAESVTRIVGDDLPPLTPNTITDPHLFGDELEHIRRRGFSFDNEEIDIGIRAVAATVSNHHNEPVAAIVVAGPSHRIPKGDDSSLLSSLKEAAARVTGELQCRSQ